jgi:hypothetical protein
MKVQELSDTDIMNYLMTSEFNEGLTPDEFRFLLYKFRYQYRLIFNRHETLKVDYDRIDSDIKGYKENYTKNINNLTSERDKAETKYSLLLNRKLSWKERIKGKIILKENEINGI